MGRRLRQSVNGQLLGPWEPAHSLLQGHPPEGKEGGVFIPPARIHHWLKFPQEGVGAGLPACHA